MTRLKRIQIWTTDQARPVIATFPEGEEPIQACAATPDFVRIRNVVGGDWILPVRKIVKARIQDTNAEEQELPVNQLGERPAFT